MGVKGDNVLLAGVHEGTESPKNVAKAAKRTFAAGLDLLTLKQSKPPAEHKNQAKQAKRCFATPPDLLPLKQQNAASQFVRNNSAGWSACRAYKGTLYRAERPLSKNSPPDCFLIHPLAELFVFVSLFL